MTALVLMVAVAATGQQVFSEDNGPATVTIQISGVHPYYDGTHVCASLTSPDDDPKLSLVRFVKRFPNRHTITVEVHRYYSNGPVWVEASVDHNGMASWRKNMGSPAPLPKSFPPQTLSWWRSWMDLPPAPSANVTAN